MEIKDTYAIGSSLLTYDIIEKILKNNIKLTLSEEAKEKIRHCREYLDSKADADAAPIYGVTTGFGSLCNKQISFEQLSTLQENLVKAIHAASASQLTEM